MNEELKKQILKMSKNDLSILDLGCGSPTDYFSLFMQFHNELNRLFNYVGVDMNDEFDVFNPHRERFDYSPNEIINRSINNYFSEDLTEDFNLNTIQSHFKFHFQTDVIKYVKSLSSENHFDIIVLSNILHKIDCENANFVFENCLEHIRENGLIYISVLGNNYKNALPEDKLFNQERFNILKEKVNVLWCNENEEFHFELIGSLKTMTEENRQTASV
jgi:SAM-dependent methyltransferase